MENWYKAVLISILALGAIVGVLVGRLQTTQSAPAFPTPPPTAVPTPVSGQIEILNSRFVPATLTVNVGQKVTWVNRDSQPHGPVANQGAFSSEALTRGQTFSWTPTKAGTYTYADFVNSNLQGEIIVR